MSYLSSAGPARTVSVALPPYLVDGALPGLPCRWVSAGADMDDRNRLALRLSYDLAGVTDREAYLNAMIESLAVVFPVDSNGWVGMDVPHGRFEFIGTNGSGSAEHAERVDRNRE